MHSTLLSLHSLIRWVVLILIVYSIYRAMIGYTKNKKFSKVDNAFRHWTATITHIQLMIGIILYTQSPIVKHFWKAPKISLQNLELTFYSVIHILLMLSSIIILTIGSAIAKRKTKDKEKFKIMLLYFSIALLIIFIAIPWTFSPLSNRPNFRQF